MATVPYTLGFAAAVTCVFLTGFVALLIFGFFAGYQDPLIYAVTIPAIYLLFWLLAIWRYRRLRRSTDDVQLSDDRSTYQAGWKDGLRCALGFSA